MLRLMLRLVLMTADADVGRGECESVWNVANASVSGCVEIDEMLKGVMWCMMSEGDDVGEACV
eukprot:7318032-Lingulodinium_polyedra.AAC.1